MLSGRPPGWRRALEGHETEEGKGGPATALPAALMAGRKRSREERKSLGPPAGSPWVGMPADLLLSWAVNNLSPHAHRLFNFLLAEHASHHAKQNGALRATYDQVARLMGVPRKYVSAALWELEAMGLVRTMQHGGRNAASRYRLTAFAWMDGETYRGPTDEWRKISPAQAKGIAADAAKMRAAASGKSKFAIRVPPGGTNLDPPWGTKGGPD